MTHYLHTVPPGNNNTIAKKAVPTDKPHNQSHTTQLRHNIQKTTTQEVKLNTRTQRSFHTHTPDWCYTY